MTEPVASVPETVKVRFPWTDVAIVFAVALVARLTHLYASAASPIFSYLTFDSIYYHTIAQYLSHGAELGHEGVFKAPLYGLFIALNYKLLGANLFLPLLLQNVFGAISCGLIYLIATRVYSRPVALIAGLCAALFGPLIYFDSEVLPTSLTIVLALTAIWAMIMFETSRRWVYPLAAGAALAVAAANAPEVLVLAVVLFIWLIRLRTPDRVNRGQIVAFALAVILPLVPILIRSYEIGRETVPFLTDVGVRLAVANNPDADGRDFRLPHSVDEPGQSYLNAVNAANRTNGREVPLQNFGSFWAGRALASVSAHPVDWLKLELRKLALLISGYEIALDKPLYYYAQQSPVLSWLLWDSGIAFPLGIILPLALLAALGPRQSRQGQFPLQALAVVFAAAVLIFSPFSHQRLPAIPAVIIWGAAGIWGMVTLVRAGDFRRFYGNLVLFVIAFAAVNGIIYAFGPEVRINSELEGRVYTGNAYLTANVMEPARLEFEEAAKADPRSPRPHSGLASVYMRLGNDSLAMLSSLRAAGLAPSDDRPYRFIVNSYKRRNKVTDLNTLLYNLMREFPKANWVFDEYADLHRRLREYTQVADIYERAYQADTTYFDAIFRKAETYLLADMRQDAEEEFRRYLSFMPSSIEAQANLGQVYARQRKLDLAEAQFELVRRAQPFSPASYFNLASLSLQRSDFLRAHAYLDTARMLNASFPGLDALHQMIDSLQTAARPPR